MVLLSTMIAALVILARNENLIAQLNKEEAQAAYAAEAGANWGRRLLHQRLSVDLPAAVTATAAPAMKAVLAPMNGCSTCGAQLIRDYAIPASGPTFQSCAAGCAEPNYSAVGPIPDAQQTVMTITCPGTAGCPANLTFTTRVIVGVHPTKPPVVTGGGNRAVFTYVWRIESSGTSGRARQQWVIHDSSVPTQTDGCLHHRAERRVREVRALHRPVPGRRLGRPMDELPPRVHRPGPHEHALQHPGRHEHAG